MFEIMKDTIPKTKPLHLGKGMAKTMRALQLGDSFLCPRSVRTSLSACASRIGIKIMTESYDNIHVKVYRIE